MKRKTKKILAVAAILVAIGAAIFAIAMFAGGWNIEALGTQKLVTTEVTIGETFENITVTSEVSDLIFTPTQDGTTKVVFTVPEEFVTFAGVSDGTLTVSSYDESQWYRGIGIFTRSPKITVFLPSAIYGDLSVDQTTGDVTIPAGFGFGSVNIEVTSGDVEIAASVQGALTVKSTTGDLTVKNLTCGALELSVTTGDVKVTGVACESLLSNGTTGRIDLKDISVGNDVTAERTTGDLTATRIQCRHFSSHTSTGDATLENVTASGKISIEATTGDVKFNSSDAAEIFAKTTTGDVSGNFLSDKIFITKATTGDVKVPGSATGGICNIETTTGDITFR